MLSLSMALCAILPAILVILVANTHIERRLVQEPSVKPSDVIWADRKAELTPPATTTTLWPKSTVYESLSRHPRT